MIARRGVIAVLLCALALLPAVAGARQGHGAPAPAAHAAKPASETATAPAPVSGAVKPPAASPAAAAAVKPPATAPAPAASSSTSDLQSALARIDNQIKATLGPTPAQAGSTRVVAPPPARIRLRWRVGLTWPAELETP